MPTAYNKVQVAKEVRELLDALDRMYGRQSLSLNVVRARDKLRQRYPREQHWDDAAPPEQQHRTTRTARKQRPVAAQGNK